MSAFFVLLSSEKILGQASSFGHNLSATTEVLKSKEVSAGLQVLAVGLSDQVSFGTSTWLLSDYNMYNGYVRYQFEKNEDYSQSIQVAFFQTMDSSRTYDMTALWAGWVHGWHTEKRYSFYLNAQFMYFFNERRPFSLRRPRIWRDPTEFIVTTLHEVELVNGFYLMGELGILGLVRKFPLIHTGASLQWRSQHWLFQFGYSLTGTTHGFGDRFSRFDSGAYLSNGDRNGLGDSASEVVKRDFSVHPEITIQYVF